MMMKAIEWQYKAGQCMKPCFDIYDWIATIGFRDCVIFCEIPKEFNETKETFIISRYIIIIAIKRLFLLIIVIKKNINTMELPEITKFLCNYIKYVSHHARTINGNC